jgi:hypothetical protein
LTNATNAAQQWIDSVKKLTALGAAASRDSAFALHCAWWRQFWDRSWIVVSGTADASAITTGYALQRYLNACAGRGANAIKFNGTLFTVSENGNIDYRRWGGSYWFQNTRCIYWPMLGSGDYDLMMPFVQQYGRPEALEADRKVTLKEYNCPGAYIHEVSYPTGTPGWYTDNNPGYQGRYYSPSLEMCSILLDYWSHTADTAMLKTILLPMAEQILLFYTSHFTTGSDGKLLLKDINAIETYWEATNPASDVAGLQWVIDNMLKLPSDLLPADLAQRWTAMRSVIPALAMIKDANGRTRLTPYDSLLSKPNISNNSENPDLYPVFPFRIYGVGKPGLDTGVYTFEKRRYGTNMAGNNGWRQEGIQAAFLGITDQASTELISRYKATTQGFSFSEIYGPNYDWTPDQTHGNNANMILQTMLCQADNGKISLFPAWPKTWNVDFRLHTALQTTIECTYVNGTIQSLTVDPPQRRNDIVVVNGAVIPISASRSCDSIEAESYNAMNGITNNTTTIGSCDSADWVRYDSINFSSTPTRVTVRVAVDSSYTNGKAEFRLDSLTGTLIGTVTVANTGGWNTFAEQTAVISGASGTHSLIVVFRNTGTGNFDLFKFSSGSVPIAGRPKAFVSQTQSMSIETYGLNGRILKTDHLAAHEASSARQIVMKGKFPHGVFIMRAESENMRTMYKEVNVGK